MSTCSFRIDHVKGFLPAVSIVLGYVALSSFVGSCLAAVKPEMLHAVFINICCQELLLVFSRPSFPLYFVPWLTSLRLASEFKYRFHFLCVFFNWTRFIQFPVWEMNIIIWRKGFQKTAVEFVDNIAKVCEVREV